jgi:hypothetical protein
MKQTTIMWIGMGWVAFVMCALFLICIGGI